MKVLITVISSLFVGLALASSNFSPIQELQYFLGNKRRLLTAAGMAVTGYIALVSAALISLVEWALQNDGQGYIVWSSLFSVGAILAAFGLFSLVIAKMMVPARPVIQPSMFADLGRQFNIAEILEGLLRNQSEAEDRGRAVAEEPPQYEAREEKFRETMARSAGPDSVFRETPSADVFHH